MTNKGIISRHLEELMKASLPVQKKFSDTSPERINKPPRPASPPKLVRAEEPETTIQDSKLSSLLDLSFKLEDPETLKQKIQNFYKGGAKTEWIQNINHLIKQENIPLIKEIIYTKEKYFKAKENYKILIKNYINERNIQKASSSPSKPPFLSSSRHPSSGSKHKSFVQQKKTSEASSKLEEMRCNVLLEINQANTELVRTVFLFFQLVAAVNSMRREMIENGIDLRNKNLEKVALKRWKEKTQKIIEQNEFLKVLRESMNWWRTFRVFLAFKDYKSRKERVGVRVRHLQAVLRFKKSKRVLLGWRNFRVFKRMEKIGKEIGKFYYESLVKIRFIYSIKVPKDLKGHELSRELVKSAVGKRLSNWYQLDRVIKKNKKDYKIFFSDLSAVNSFYLSLTRPLGSYKGLLETTRKPLYVSSELSHKQISTSDLSQKFNPVKLNKVITSNNMFTLSFANFKTDHFLPLVPEGFKLGSGCSCNKSEIIDLIKNALVYWRTLKKTQLSYHFQKAVELTRDYKGTSEKIAESQYDLKLLSSFYQNWKKKYCEKWIFKLVEKIRSLKLCKKYFTASKAWKKYFKDLDESSEKFKLKSIIAENFRRNKLKIKTYFNWTEEIAKLKGVKKIEKLLKKLLVLNSILIWKHLSKSFDVVEDLEVDWKKFDEYRKIDNKNIEVKTVGFDEKALYKDQKREVIKKTEHFNKLEESAKKVKEKLKTMKPKQMKKTGKLKTAENLKQEDNEESELKLAEKMGLAERYHKVLLKKKTMCGFIHALKLFYKKLKSDKFAQIKRQRLVKITFERLVSHALLCKRKTVSLSYSQEYYSSFLFRKYFGILKKYYFSRIKSHENNFKAIDQYLFSLQRRASFSIDFSKASSPVLAFLFYSWKNMPKHSKSAEKVLSVLERLMKSKYLAMWKKRSNDTIKSISSIFRDLEDSLKRTLKSYSPTKKVRFNV